MAVRLVNIDRNTPLLLPPDLRDWVPDDHIVHFILEEVAALPRLVPEGTLLHKYPQRGRPRSPGARPGRRNWRRPGG